MTIEEGKKHIEDNLDKGVDCPCCGHMNKAYKRSLNSGLVKLLAWMYVETQNRSPLHAHYSEWQYINIEPFLKTIDMPHRILADFNLLVKYDLVYPHPTKAGWYKIYLSETHSYLFGERLLPAWIKVYQKRVVERSSLIHFVYKYVDQKEIELIISHIGPVVTVKAEEPTLGNWFNLRIPIFGSRRPKRK